MTQTFKTSKISATVAPCRSAALMDRRVVGAYMCKYEAPRAIFTNSMSFRGKAPLEYISRAEAISESVQRGARSDDASHAGFHMPAAFTLSEFGVKLGSFTRFARSAKASWSVSVLASSTRMAPPKVGSPEGCEAGNL